MNKRQRIAANEAFRLRYEKAFIKQIKKALDNQISSFISELASGGISAAMANINRTVINESVAPVISELYVRAGIAAARRQLAMLRREPMILKRGGFGFNEQWTNEILDYFRLNLFSKVVLPITETTKQQFRLAIEQGIKEGWTNEQIIAKLKDSDIIAWRARMIIRTEANRAINYGYSLGSSSFDYETVKEWVAVHDNRTRHSHLALDGTQIEANGVFSNGLEFPGDPNGSGAETINCRCHLEYKALRDADGRLVPKKNKRVTYVNRRTYNQIQDVLRQLN